MASAVATPLERQFGRIADVTEMTSSSQLGSTSSPCSSISTAMPTPPRVMWKPPLTPPAASCPPIFRSNPGYWKMNPANAPILMLGHHLRRLRSRSNVRYRRLDPGPETFANRWRRTSAHLGQFAPSRTRSTESAFAECHGTEHYRCRDGPAKCQCSSGQRRHRQRSSFLAGSRHRRTLQSRAIFSADCQIPQQGARATGGHRQRYRFRGRCPQRRLG